MTPSRAAWELEAFRRADHAAISRLLDRYRGWLNLLARLQNELHLDGRLDAADVAQQTLLEAFRAARSFRGNSEVEFVNWLRRILARVMRDRAGGDVNFRGLPAALALEFDNQLSQLSQRLGGLLSERNAADAIGPARDQQVILADALHRLPPDYREILILRNLEGHSLEAIAERWESDVRAVSQLWLRALRQLRDSTARGVPGRDA